MTRPSDHAFALADALIAYIDAGSSITVSVDADSGAMTFRIDDDHIVQRFIERGEQATDGA